MAREVGADVAAVLAELNLTTELLLAPETRLSPDQGRALGRALIGALPPDVDRCELGLRAAERFVIGDADLLGYIMNHSAHPLAAAHALAEHARLIGDSADFRVEVADQRVVVTLSLIGAKQMLPEAADFAVAIIVRLLSDGSRGKARPLSVKLPRPPPPANRAQIYRRYFGVPVEFGALAGTLIYSLSCMRAPFTSSDHRLVEILKQHAQLRLGAPSADWQDRVRAIIADGLLRGDYALERVAWRCGLGSRTLRRRLADGGTSYRALVDDVRKERALLLLESSSNITFVADQLGFSDGTAFARAFRRWTGVAPHSYVRSRRS
ncbi:MAG TPA: AraC family transcriptional regulator ligand-binding domain-containing protein [Polyangiales bacterium]|nr:AraC family transcriptional regulator ligand-binding domain-containing protein [Polyangiales bacterium]